MDVDDDDDEDDGQTEWSDHFGGEMTGERERAGEV